MKRSLGSVKQVSRSTTPRAFSAWRDEPPAPSDQDDRPVDGEAMGPVHDPMPFPGQFAYLPMPVFPQALAASIGTATHMATANNFPAQSTAQGTKQGTEPPENAFERLMDAIGAEDREAFARALQCDGIDIDRLDAASGLSPLLLASLNGDAWAVLALLDNGADPDIPCAPLGLTALMHAAKHDHVEVLDILVARRGIALDMKNRDGRTALHLSAYYGHSRSAIGLLVAGAMANVVDHCGFNPLMLAAHHGSVEVASILLASGKIDLDAVDSVIKRTALHIAAFSNELAVSTFLLAAGADPNRADELGETALMSAVAENNIDIVQLLAAWPGIELDALSSEGMSALHIAIKDARPDLARCLIEAGASLHLRDARHASPLDLAMRAKSAATIEVMLEHGATLEQFDGVADDKPFTIAVADLQAVHSPSAMAEGPFALADAVETDATPPIFVDMLAALDTRADLVQWLRGQRIMIGCAHGMAECLAFYHDAATALKRDGPALDTRQKLWLCISALSRMPQRAARDGDTLAYRQSGLSPSGLAKLAKAAGEQSIALNGLVDHALTTFGTCMTQNLISDCMNRTTAKYGAVKHALQADLIAAGFLAPLTKAIVRSWQSALSAIESTPFIMPALASHKQVVQELHAKVERHAPTLFVTALRSELASQALLKGLRKLVGDTKNADVLDILFQMQCDQLRQYCAQMESVTTEQ